MELATVFRKRKMICVVCRKDQEKLKKMLDFIEAFIEGSGNFKTLSSKLLTKVNISKLQNVESIIIQLCNEPVI